MADKVAIDLVINAAGSAKTVKELKQSISDLKNAALTVSQGSSEFIKLGGAINSAQTKINDLNKSIKNVDTSNLAKNLGSIGSTLAGGFQAAQGAMALFGAESKDVEKALLKVQAATALAQGIQSVQDLGKAFQALNLIVRANPIGIISTAVIALGVAVVALKDKFKAAGLIFDFFGDIVKDIVQTFKDFSDAIGMSNFKLDEQIEKQKKLREEKEKSNKVNREALQYANEYLTVQDKGINAAQREIELMKVRGDNAANIAKKEIELNNKKIELLDNLIRFQENDLEKEKIRDQQRALLHSNEIIRLNEQKRNYRQSTEGLKEFDNIKREDIALTDEQIKKNKELQESTMQLSVANKWSAEDELKYKEDIAKAEISLQDAKINAAMNAFAVGQQLAGKNKALANTLFALEKAMAIAQVVVNTQREISGYMSNPIWSLAPDGGASVKIPAILAAKIRAATSIATIAATAIGKYASAKGGGTSGITTGGRSTSASQGVNINPLRSTTSTMIEREKVEEGQSVVRAYVVESELTSKQKGISNIVKKSKI